MPRDKTRERQRQRARRGEKASVKAAAAAKLRSDMLDLRIAGYTYEQIAETVSQTAGREIPVNFVRKELDEAIQDIVLPKAEVAKALLVEQITRVMPAHYNAAVGGDVGAVHGLIALVDRMTRLLGLNEPEKTQHVGADGKPLNVIPVLNVSIAQPSLPRPNGAGTELMHNVPSNPANPPQLKPVSKTG